MLTDVVNPPAMSSGAPRASTTRAAISSISAGLRGALDEYRELVPAEPRCRVAGPQDAGEAGGDGDQEVVAHAVAHRVVDELEVVQVDEKDPHHTAVTVGRGRAPARPDPGTAPGSRDR